MAIQNRALMDLVHQVLGSQRKAPAQYRYEATLHVAGTVVPNAVFAFDYMDQSCNLIELDAPIMSVELRVVSSVYSQYIEPHKDELEVTVYRTPLGLGGDGVVYSTPNQTERFKARLLEGSNEEMEGNVQWGSEKSGNHIGSLQTVKFELTPIAYNAMRMKMTGGIFKDCIPGDVIRAVLSAQLKGLELSDDARITGVDMITPNNTTARNHVMIPHGLKTLTLPQYVQERAGGVYNAGLGHFVYNRCWYVFPLYDITRFDSTDKTLTLINLPANFMPGVENTYRIVDKQLKVLITGQTAYDDDSEQLRVNLGNGTRFVNADRVIGRFLTPDNENRMSGDRNTNMTEMYSLHRRDGEDSALLSNTRIVSNLQNEMSVLARMNGSFLTVTWDNSDHFLLRPGMPVKYYYTFQEELRTVYGTLVGFDTFVSPGEKSGIASKHTSTSSLTVFIERIENL